MADRPWTDEEYWRLQTIMAENDKRRHYSLPSLSDKEIEHYIAKLKLNWKYVVGDDLSKVTKPLAITGKKSRRLIVIASPNYTPPWGSWDSLEANPKAFSEFRSYINNAIDPHFVDHVDFIESLCDFKP
jgi:hypothetical protein